MRWRHLASSDPHPLPFVRAGRRVVLAALSASAVLVAPPAAADGEPPVPPAPTAGVPAPAAVAPAAPAAVAPAAPAAVAPAAPAAVAPAAPAAVAPAAPAAVAPAPAASATAEPQTDRAAAQPRPFGKALAVLGVDLEVAGRMLSYSDLLSENLRTYDVLGVPMPALRAEVYPLARMPMPVLRDLGLVLSYARALGLDSEGPDGSSVPTSWNRLHAGLRGRIRPAGEAGPIVGVGAGVRWTDFSFETEGDLKDETSSVSYVALRLGVDGRLPVGPCAIEAGAGYQVPLSTGDLALRFRGPSAGGVDLDAAVAVPFPSMPALEARAGASYTRFFYSFESEPEDPYIAGGALDQFFNLHVGVTYAYQ
jgi:hypothetical protein